MEQLLTLLKTIPEYSTMLSALRSGESAAVTGIGQINRSHMIAGLVREVDRPMVLLFQLNSLKMKSKTKDLLQES